MKPGFNLIILLLTAFAVSLVALRIIVTGSLCYLFLLWNLFLAFVPYWISSWLTRKSRNALATVPLLGLWLLFIPNAPYLLTDLFHLHPRGDAPFWLDLVLILSFAMTGLLLFYRSFADTMILLKNLIGGRYLRLLMAPLLWLIAFGLYLGRYGRFNSWDVIQSPVALLSRSLQLLASRDTMAFTCIFSVFMWLVYLTLLNFNPGEKTDA